MKLQGILIFLTIIKALDLIEKYNSKIGMLFKVIQLVKNEIINLGVIFLFIF